MNNYLTAETLDDPAFDKLIAAHTDITGAHHVEVRLDRPKRVLHVNVNGICVLRVCQINVLDLEETTMSESAFFTISGTGCTCCSNSDRIFGPMESLDEALSLAESNKQSKCWASQYASEGKHEIARCSFERLSDGRLIIGDRVYKGFSSSELGHPDEYEMEEYL